MKRHARNRTWIGLFALCAGLAASGAGATPQDRVHSVVDRVIQPLMAKDHIAGMAVGVIDRGRTYVFSYGVASKQTERPVTDTTLFELGSISKTFTATLASWAQVKGDLSLSDPVRKYLPELKGSAFGKVTLLNLGTHTPGGLPLQVPDTIKSNDQLMQYFREWRPLYAPGTMRTYANPGIGTLGLIVARGEDETFDSMMEKQLLPLLGLKHTFIHVPETELANYAQGYTAKDTPIRAAPGVLSSEAYGLKSTAKDLIRWEEENMRAVALEPKLARAITDTHTGYFRAGVMTQDLIWEEYAWPVTLATLLDGNSARMLLQPTPATEIWPPQPPRDDVLINKTGSTNGFGDYIAFVPEKRLGIVILANRNYPISERVTAAYEILTSVGGPLAAQ